MNQAGLATGVASGLERLVIGGGTLQGPVRTVYASFYSKT
jgi:glutamyl-tRNA reductase